MDWNESTLDSARDSTRNIDMPVSDEELDYLRPGLSQPGGKLPLFDVAGQRVNPKTMQACIQKGLCEPWFANPMKPDWLVCRLTDKGRQILVEHRGRRTVLT